MNKNVQGIEHFQEENVLLPEIGLCALIGVDADSIVIRFWRCSDNHIEICRKDFVELVFYLGWDMPAYNDGLLILTCLLYLPVPHDWCVLGLLAWWFVVQCYMLCLGGSLMIVSMSTFVGNWIWERIVETSTCICQVSLLLPTRRSIWCVPWLLGTQWILFFSMDVS